MGATWWLGGAGPGPKAEGMDEQRAGTIARLAAVTRELRAALDAEAAARHPSREDFLTSLRPNP